MLKNHHWLCRFYCRWWPCIGRFSRGICCVNFYTSLMSQKNTTISVNIAFPQHDLEARGFTTSQSLWGRLEIPMSVFCDPLPFHSKYLKPSDPKICDFMIQRVCGPPFLGKNTGKPLCGVDFGRILEDFFCFLDSLCEPFWAILCLTGIGEVPLAVRASHNSPSQFFEPNDLSATLELSTTILAATVRRNTWTDRPSYGRGTNLEAEQCC